MKIGIDASKMAVLQKTGTEYYTREIIKHLAQIDNQNSYFLYSKRGISLSLPNNFKNIVISLPYLWTQVGLSFRMLLNPPDVLFIPAHVMPIIHPKKVVVACHDVAFEKYSTSYSSFQLWYLKWFVKKTVKKSHKIIAVSESTKNDLIELYRCPEAKIEVIYHGYNEKIFKPVKNPKVNLAEPYLLFVGRIEERKNVKGLISAFSILKNKFNNLKLVLIGKPGFGYQDIKQFINDQPKNVRRNIIELGYLDEEKLPDYYSKALLFVLPSFYEGFGLPILEAMACGCSVICSKTSSLPEIGKEAALYFNPQNHQEIAEMMTKVLKNHHLRRDLIKKGFQNIKRFSWQKSAQETLKVLTEK